MLLRYKRWKSRLLPVTDPTAVLVMARWTAVVDLPDIEPLFGGGWREVME